MTKADLKDWMIVTTDEGRKYIVDRVHEVLLEYGAVDSVNQVLVLDYFTDDLRRIDNDSYNITRVFEPSEMQLSHIFDGDGCLLDMNLIWIRPEPAVEMTIAEIEEKLGIKNLKIVKEDEDGSHHYQCKEFKSVARRNIECSHKQYLDIPSDFVHNSNIAFWILDDITMEEKYGKDGRSPEYECLMKELEQNRNEENESMKGRPEWLKKLWQ